MKPDPPIEAGASKLQSRRPPGVASGLDLICQC